MQKQDKLIVFVVDILLQGEPYKTSVFRTYDDAIKWADNNDDEDTEFVINKYIVR